MFPSTTDSLSVGERGFPRARAQEAEGEAGPVVGLEASQSLSERRRSRPEAEARRRRRSPGRERLHRSRAARRRDGRGLFCERAEPVQGGAARRVFPHRSRDSHRRGGKSVPLPPNGTRHRPAAETRPDSTDRPSTTLCAINFKGADPSVGALGSRTSCLGRVRRTCPTTNATYCDGDRTPVSRSRFAGEGRARPPVEQWTVSGARWRKRILLFVIRKSRVGT
jgi:hypothetical protein